MKPIIRKLSDGKTAASFGSGRLVGYGNRLTIRDGHIVRVPLRLVTMRDVAIRELEAMTAKRKEAK